MQFFDNKGSSYSEGDQDQNLNINDSDNGVELNKKNAEEYNKLMAENSTNKDIYYDKRNPIIKIILLVLAVIILLGVFFIVTRGMG